MNVSIYFYSEFTQLAREEKYFNKLDIEERQQATDRRHAMELRGDMLFENPILRASRCTYLPTEIPITRLDLSLGVLKATVESDIFPASYWTLHPS